MSHLGLIASCIAGAAIAAVPADLVTSLSGYGAPKTATYSGYLAIAGNKNLHYIFYESKRSPSSDPVAVWFNGGPGCSSLEGAFQESGPYWTKGDGSGLEDNTWTWTNFSNTLYIESPVCVGFSYGPSCSSDDTSAAVDNLAAMVQFFTLYPEFQKNDFYITGESYAGIYIPMLAYNIYGYNTGTPAPAFKINMKGIIVGNGCIGTTGVCGNSLWGDYLSLSQYYGHGFISDKAWAAANAACGTWNGTESPACRTAIRAISVGNVDVYDLYSGIYGVCDYGNLKGKPIPKGARGPNTRVPRRPIDEGTALAHLTQGVLKNNPCSTDAALETYMNTAAVQTALHVRSKTFVVCGGVQYRKTMVDERVLIYPTLIEKAGIKVVILSGESDSCVPLTDTQWWTSSMGYAVVQPWTAWTTSGVAGSSKTVGGYVTQYTNNFTFITVRGSGHMVPQMQPLAAWDVAYNTFFNLPWSS